MWNRDVSGFPRRFPRTLREAFRDADYACALERPREMSGLERMMLAIICIGAVALAVATISVWVSL